MRPLSIPTFSLAQFRAWLVTLSVLASTASFASATPIYSNTGVASISEECSGLGCLALGVDDANRAANADLKGDYAVMNKNLSAATTVRLRLGLSGTGHRGDRAGLLVATGPTLLGISALGTYTIRTYLNGSATPQETQVVDLSVLQGLGILAAAGKPTQLEFTANADFDAVELSIAGAASLGYSLRVYYAYGMPALVPQPAQGLASRYSAADLTPYYNTAVTPGGGVSVCGNTNVINPQYAVDASLTNHASFGTFISLNCPSTLSVKLEDGKTAPAGYYAGFVLGSGGLLDLAALSGLRITTYKTINGVRTKQESASGVGLLNLTLLPNGKYQVSFPSTLPFDEVQLEQIDGLSVLNNLDIYYGFGIEPSAFQGSTRVVSNFDAATAPGKATSSVSSLLCALCGVTTPAGAADNDPATSATMVVTAGVATTVSLKVDLNGNGMAGDRAGMVIQNNGNNGLIDLALLNNLTLSTYDSDGNLLETASGASLLSVSLLADGRQEVSFRTTQNFASVKISAASLLGVGVDIKVFQAFADNKASGSFPTIVPLPVELTAFTGRWATGAAELSWATASEKNSSYFVVERSSTGDSFAGVGQVGAAGNSSSAHTYKLRDAEAGTLGVPTLYYRLRQVDIDGKQVYSSVVTVTVGQTAAAQPRLELYPNPAPDAQSVNARFLNLPTAGGTVQTYSEMGQLVSVLPIQEATQRLALPTLAPGLYHLVLRDAAGRQLATQRLVIGGR